MDDSRENDTAYATCVTSTCSRLHILCRRANYFFALRCAIQYNTKSGYENFIILHCYIACNWFEQIIKWKLLWNYHHSELHSACKKIMCKSTWQILLSYFLCKYYRIFFKCLDFLDYLRNLKYFKIILATPFKIVKYIYNNNIIALFCYSCTFKKLFDF